MALFEFLAALAGTALILRALHASGTWRPSERRPSRRIQRAASTNPHAPNGTSDKALRRSAKDDIERLRGDVRRLRSDVKRLNDDTAALKDRGGYR